jgi:hypothetical protein
VPALSASLTFENLHRAAADALAATASRGKKQGPTGEGKDADNVKPIAYRAGSFKTADKQESARFAALAGLSLKDAGVGVDAGGLSDKELGYYGRGLRGFLRMAMERCASKGEAISSPYVAVEPDDARRPSPLKGKHSGRQPPAAAAEDEDDDLLTNGEDSTGLFMQLRQASESVLKFHLDTSSVEVADSATASTKNNTDADVHADAMKSKHPAIPLKIAKSVQRKSTPTAWGGAPQPSCFK